MNIHATAIVAKTAQIANDAEIGPYVIIGPHVIIGAETRVMSHAVIDGHTRIGQRCHIYPGACIGMPAQDKNAKTTKPLLTIGDDNVIREYVTIHSSSQEGLMTRIGNRNFLMASCHIAHDCFLGDDNVIANFAGLSGHVVIEDKVVIGGLTGVHQYTRVGKHAMVGGVAKVNANVPPFSLCDGDPIKFMGANSVGLKRSGYTTQAISEIKKVLKIFFASGLSFQNAMDKVRNEFDPTNQDIQYIIEFVEKSEKGIARASAIVEV